MIPRGPQTLASGFQLSARCNRRTNRQPGRAEAPRAWGLNRIRIPVLISPWSSPSSPPIINIAKHLLFFIQPYTVDE